MQVSDEAGVICAPLPLVIEDPWKYSVMLSRVFVFNQTHPNQTVNLLKNYSIVQANIIIVTHCSVFVCRPIRRE